jgi:hypothetical protein
MAVLEPTQLPTWHSLPRPRGAVSDRILAALQSPPHDLRWSLGSRAVDPEDLHLSLYCCYELHYQGFPGVDPGWEWEPSLLGVRRDLEERFTDRLREMAGTPGHGTPEEVIDRLWQIAEGDGGPSLSGWVDQYADLGHVRELSVHRSAYQCKEADPHTWAIPRLTGEAKATMVAIQADEYGNGAARDMHSVLFGDTMLELGLDPTPNRYLDVTPAVTLATTNLISLLGLHRRWRGALVGHLALFEMTSIGPMARYARALRRLGLSEVARRFYDVHVEADQHHQHLASEGMVGGLLRSEPHLASDVLFGAGALSAVEGAFAAHVRSSWAAGRSSLLDPD